MNVHFFDSPIISKHCYVSFGNSLGITGSISWRDSDTAFDAGVGADGPGSGQQLVWGGGGRRTGPDRGVGGSSGLTLVSGSDTTARSGSKEKRNRAETMRRAQEGGRCRGQPGFGASRTS